MNKIVFFILLLPLFLIASERTYLTEENSDYTFTSQEATAFSAVGFRISGGAIEVNALGGWAL